MTMDRRAFLRSAAAAGAVGLAWPHLGAKTAQEARAQAALLGVVFDPGPFTIGVASGDPLPGSVVIWTRLAPEPLLPGGGMGATGTVDVDWVVAADPRLRRVVARGTAPADPALAHSVHVDVRGLEPGTTYFYRFAAGGRVSRIGRTRTAPAPGTGDRVRFAFVSCAKFHAGSFVAYRRMVHEDLDLVVCLGDYLYEEVAVPGEYRAEGDGEMVALDDYRRRYALYRGDPDLRAAHAAFPWVVTWDDHEVDNNYAGLIPENRDAEERNLPEDFPQRRADAYAASYEHMPYRLGGDDDSARPPSGPDFQIYRRFAYGDLLDLTVIDTRQYRSDQPCDDATGVVICGGVDDPAATILGADQKAFLFAQLERDVAWRCVANQVMVGQLKVGGLPNEVTDAVAASGLATPTADGNYLNADQWDGYQAERRELLGHIAEREIPDVVVITGDIHSHWVHDLKVDFDDPTDPVVAAEFVGTSITSGGFPEGSDPAVRAALAPSNPHIRYYEGEQRGYAVCDVTRERWRTTFRVVADVTDPRSPVSTLAAFEVQRGVPGATQVEGGGGQPPRLPSAG